VSVVEEEDETGGREEEENRNPSLWKDRSVSSIVVKMCGFDEGCSAPFSSRPRVHLSTNGERSFRSHP
jgi:hypothetical protein